MELRSLTTRVTRLRFRALHIRVIKAMLTSAVVLVVLAACGSAPGAGVGANPSPSYEPPVAGAPAAGFDVLVTDKDQDITVHAGQRIEVYLRRRTGLTTWNGLRSDDDAVLVPIPTGIAAPVGVTIGGFKAITPGTASISAYATASCSPNQACPMFAALFSVRVTVL
jgi:hypothetical protein